jgi:hypothetical protein
MQNLEAIIVHCYPPIAGPLGQLRLKNCAKPGKNLVAGLLEVLPVVIAIQKRVAHCLLHYLPKVSCC